MSIKCDNYLPSVFSKLVEKYKRHTDNAELPELKTEDVDEEYKQQFQKLKLDKDNAIPLPKGGVAVFYHMKDLCEHHTHIALLGSFIPEIESKNSNNFLYIEEEGNNPALFLHLAYNFTPYLKLKKDITESKAFDILDVCKEKGYKFNIYDIIGYHDEIYVFNINKESILYGKSNEEIIICLLIESPYMLHSERKEYLDLIKLILDSESGKNTKLIDYGMILSSISSYYNRHAFLDIYRCLEKLFFFPEIYELSQHISKETKKNLDIPKLKSICKESLSWQPKENISISKLLQIIFLDEVEHTDEKGKVKKDITFYENSEKICNNFINEMSISIDNESSTNINTKKVEKISEYIYKYRNSLVHHEDKEYTNLKKLTEEEWLKIAYFIANALLFFSNKFS